MEKTPIESYIDQISKEINTGLSGKHTPTIAEEPPAEETPVVEEEPAAEETIEEGWFDGRPLASKFWDSNNKAKKQLNDYATINDAYNSLRSQQLRNASSDPLEKIDTGTDHIEKALDGLQKHMNNSKNEHEKHHKIAKKYLDSHIKENPGHKDHGSMQMAHDAATHYPMHDTVSTNPSY